jgi:hypothetical protein
VIVLAVTKASLNMSGLSSACWLYLEGLGLELPLLEAANLPCARGSVDLLDGQPFSVDGSWVTFAVLFLLDLAWFSGPAFMPRFPWGSVFETLATISEF